MSLGEILDRTFSLYRRHFLLFLGITAIPNLLVLAFNLAQTMMTKLPVPPVHVPAEQLQSRTPNGFLKPAWQTVPAPGGPAHSHLGADRLSADECALIDSFLNRRLDPAPDVRFRMADEIFRRLKPKLTLPAENTLSTERILETLAYERRATGGYA